ncbi:MAG: hypothetical protein ACYC64_05910 [Armatimonadota bacterium]
MDFAMDQYQLFWGDSHNNVRIPHINRLDAIIDGAASHLDFYPIAYYPFYHYIRPDDIEHRNGLIEESMGHLPEAMDGWAKIQNAVAQANSPGSFVTFLGYEWHGNRFKYGDHNVYYKTDFEELDPTWDLLDLFETLKRKGAIAIPHHTAIQVGMRGKDWHYHDPEVTPFAEIFSFHGSSEGCGFSCGVEQEVSRHQSMGPHAAGGSIQDGLAAGNVFGIIASNDSHNCFPGVWGSGLMAAYAEDLSRDSLWESFRARRVYGVTGDRIKLWFELNGHPMGTVITQRPAARVLRGSVKGRSLLDRVEIVRNNRVIKTFNVYESDKPKADRKCRVWFRLRFGWGPGRDMQINHTLSPKIFNPGWQNQIREPLGNKQWVGDIEIESGQILDAEGCFTTLGQSLEKGPRLSWDLTTLPRDEYGLFSLPTPDSYQGILVHAEGTPGSVVRINLNSDVIETTLGQILQGCQVHALSGTRELMQSFFEVDPDTIKNPDMFWRCAYKMQINKGYIEEDTACDFEFVDESDVPPGTYYYVRVGQRNGQMAWSSPIWV